MLGLVDKTGESMDNIYLMDNDGIIRSIILLESKIIHNDKAGNDSADDLAIYNNFLYYNITAKEIAKVSRLGKVEEIINLGKYSKHHDFKIYNNKIWVLATDDTNSESIEDIILMYDLHSNSIEKIIDFKELLPEIYNKSNRPQRKCSDWIHINSVDILEDTILVSSRELSAIIEVKDIYNEPKLNCILGLEEIYEDTNLKNKVYEKVGDFEYHLGQHTAFYVDGDKNCIGLYNNNLGKSEAVDWIDWTKYADMEEDNSYYYEYKVDRQNETYELIQKIEVPNSPYMSGAQYCNDNIIISSRRSRFLGEFTKTGEMVKTFIMNRGCYRIRKYNFDKFWFRH